MKDHGVDGDTPADEAVSESEDASASDRDGDLTGAQDADVRLQCV